MLQKKNFHKIIKIFTVSSLKENFFVIVDDSQAQSRIFSSEMQVNAAFNFSMLAQLDSLLFELNLTWIQ